MNNSVEKPTGLSEDEKQFHPYYFCDALQVADGNDSTALHYVSIMDPRADVIDIVSGDDTQTLRFQQGRVDLNGRNGLTIESVLMAAKERILRLNHEHPHECNVTAVHCIDASLQSLLLRRHLQRGIESPTVHVVGSDHRQGVMATPKDCDQLKEELLSEDGASLLNIRV